MTEFLNEKVILSQIISNVYYREKVVPYIKPDYFEHSDNRDLSRTILTLLDKKVTTLDKTTLLLDYPNKEKIDEIFEVSYPNENIENLIKDTEKWCKDRALYIAILKGADIIAERKDVNLIDSLVKEALSVSFDQDLGLDYQHDIEARFERYAEGINSLSTGYTMLDHYTNGGIQNKTLSVILGQSNLGKSHVLCNLTTNLNTNGYNGIYLTLELDKEVIGRRCDSINTQIPYFSLLKEKNKAINILKKLKGGNTFIKQYPSSKASCVNIRTYLKELEIHKKFKPDFLIVDSLNLMKPNGNVSVDNMYNFYGRITIELRELAIELNIPVITAIHVKTSSYGAADINQEDVRGSLAVMEVSDLGIALIQTPDQEPENMITWKLIKNRLGRRNGRIETKINMETLKISEIITSEDREILNNQKTYDEVLELNKAEGIELDNLLKDDADVVSFDGFS